MYMIEMDLAGIDGERPRKNMFNNWKQRRHNKK